MLQTTATPVHPKVLGLNPLLGPVELARPTTQQHTRLAIDQSHRVLANASGAVTLSVFLNNLQSGNV